MSVYVGNTTTNTVITLTSISQSGVSGQVIPSGANVTFHQSTAPVGFTKITVYDDYSMRVVSGSVANKTNGIAFTSAFVSQSIDGSVGSTTLTSSQVPATGVSISDPGHVHPVHAYGLGLSFNPGGGNFLFGGGYSYTGRDDAWNALSRTTGISASVSGSGGSHNHAFTGTAINLAVNYVDLILATAN